MSQQKMTEMFQRKNPGYTLHIFDKIVEEYIQVMRSFRSTKHIAYLTFSIVHQFL